MGKKWLPSLKGLKKAKEAAQTIPRSVDEIRQEYTDICSKLGHAKYQVVFNQQVVDALIGKLKDLDGEAGARKRLDETTPKQETTPEGVKNV